MKFKVLIVIIILFCYPLISQEKYQGLTVVTWEKIQNLDYTILSDDEDVIIVMIDGKTYIVENR